MTPGFQTLDTRRDSVLVAGGILLAWLTVAGLRTLVSTGQLAGYILVNKLLGLACLLAS